MATKRGTIVEVAQVGAKFTEARLDSGQRVEVPNDLWQHIRSHYPNDQVLVFVERRGRLFSYVQWVGTDQEAWRAIKSGDLTEREYPEPYGMPAPWGRVAAEQVERDEEEYRAVRAQPWGEEALAGQRAALQKRLTMVGVFSRPNPYFCLSLDALMIWGLAAPEAVHAAMDRIAREAVPPAWRDPVMLRELSAVYSPAESLVRIGLWRWGTALEQGPSVDELRAVVGRLHAEGAMPATNRTESTSGENARRLRRVQQKWSRAGGAVSPLMRPVVQSCRPVAVNGNVVSYEFLPGREFLRDRAIHRADEMAQITSELLGVPAAIEILGGEARDQATATDGQ